MDNENQTKPTVERLATISMILGFVMLLGFCLSSILIIFEYYRALGYIHAFTTFLAPALTITAIICGHQALKRISAASGTLRGKKQAVAGLVTGYIGLLLCAMVMLWNALINHDCPCPRAPMGASAVCISNFRKIGIALREYAKGHQDLLPPDLETLQKAGLISPDELICRDNKGAGATDQPSYLYFGAGFKLSDTDDDTILIAERERFHKNNPELAIGFGGRLVHEFLVSGLGDLATIARKHGWKLPGPEKDTTNGTNATSGTPPKAP
jgi:hypothetical protein